MQMAHLTSVLDGYICTGFQLVALSVKECTGCCVAESQACFIDTFRLSNKFFNEELCKLNSVICP